MCNQQLAAALHEKSEFFVGEDVEGIDPGRRLRTGLSVIRIHSSFKGAQGKEIREGELFWLTIGNHIER
jgi:hypothetical protein